MSFFFSKKGGINVSFRVLLIESELELKIKLDNLVINKDGNDLWIPLSDISMIVFDNLKAGLTMRTLVEIAEYNIGLLVCDNKHFPIGFYSSFDNHSRIAKMLNYQIENTKDLADYWWQKIIMAKIQNQRAVLKKLEKKEILEKMASFAEMVQPGDPTNREAHAAKIYFNTLMGTSFSRGNEDILLNSGLDYGYSVIRSYLAKLCAGYGLNGQLGLHHKNEFNRFNLVDDLMEPIRPFVDYVAYKLLKEEKYFKMEHRHKLINILNSQMKYRGKTMYFSNMLDDYISQYAALISGRTGNIIFPEIECFIFGEEKDEV